MDLELVLEDMKKALKAKRPEVRFEGPDDAETGRWPRVQWQPERGAYQPGRGLGAGAKREGDLWQRVVTVIFVIWEENVKKTAVLLDELINVGHDALGAPNFQPLSDDWELGGVDDDGVVCMLSAALHVPVQRTPQRTQKITGVAVTTKMGSEQVP